MHCLGHHAIIVTCVKTDWLLVKKHWGRGNKVETTKEFT